MSRALLKSLGALLGTAIVGAIAFATGLVLFDEVVMPRFVRQGGDITVPDLSNLNKDQAEMLLAHEGLMLSVSSERFDPAIPRGFVITQDNLKEKRYEMWGYTVWKKKNG